MTELALRCHQFEKRVAHALGLSVDETHCLSQLYLHIPFCVRKLTELLGVSTTRVSRLLSRLEQRGLITRNVNPNDRRIELVSLTGEGLAVVTRLLDMSADSEGDIFAGLRREDHPAVQRGPDGVFTD